MHICVVNCQNTVLKILALTDSSLIKCLQWDDLYSQLLTIIYMNMLCVSKGFFMASKSFNYFLGIFFRRFVVSEHIGA